MNGIIRIAVATPRLALGDTRANAREMETLARQAVADDVAVVAFPELSITGYTCGDLFFRGDLLDAARAALIDFATHIADLPIAAIVGLPMADGPAVYNAATVICGGRVIGTVRKRVLPTYAEYYEGRQFVPAPQDEPVQVFDTGSFRFGVEICEDLWTPIPPSSLMACRGVDAVFNISASTDFLGKSRHRREMVRQQSARLGCVYAMSCAGVGESSADAVFGGGSLIAANGGILSEMALFGEDSRIITADVDLEALRYRRRSDTSLAERPPDREPVRVSVTAKLPTVSPKTVSTTPFLDEYGEQGWHRKILAIQAAALARRMESAHIRKLTVGVSGGADSALALLGAASALDRLGIARDHLMAVVMPGFGSTPRTQNTAVALSRAIGASVRMVDIREACRRHLADIGHTENDHDIAYENVQARERTQVLMDLANMSDALVVGTGDLSEIALGWNTYNGDHMSMYQLNASIPKTMVLAALRLIAEESDEPLRSLLAGIAAAPITPELVPDAAPNDSEARLGPYGLHDFFLFHTIANGASADKMLALARIAFRDVYPDETLVRTHTVFLRRFRQAQYKRNCVPDGPKITLSLSPRADWRMPSDVSTFS